MRLVDWKKAGQVLIVKGVRAERIQIGLDERVYSLTAEIQTILQPY